MQLMHFRILVTAAGERDRTQQVRGNSLPVAMPFYLASVFFL